MNPTDQDNRTHFVELLKQFDTAMLVTHAEGDQIRARPMEVARIDDDGTVWFISGKDSGKIHEIADDQQISVVCQNDRKAYLSLSALARVIRDRAVIAELWQESFQVWFPGGKDDPNIALIAARPEQGEYWDNEGFRKIEYLFSAAKAYATGTTPEIKEGEQHGKVSF